MKEAPHKENKEMDNTIFFGDVFRYNGSKGIESPAFIGLSGYRDEPPFDSSTLVLFRKRFDVDAIMDANTYMFDSRNDDNNHD